MHIRKKNFLELRLRDPESLYEVEEVRLRIKPKRQAFNEQYLVNKGMMRKEKFDFSSRDPNKQHN